MSSRPRRSKAGENRRYSPTLEESSKASLGKNSQPRQQSSSQERTSTKKTTPVKKEPASKQQPSPKQKKSTTQPKANDPNLFISKAGRLSVPSSKVSVLSFANFGRKCLSTSAEVETVAGTKRRSTSNAEPPAKKPHIKLESDPLPSDFALSESTPISTKVEPIDSDAKLPVEEAISDANELPMTSVESIETQSTTIIETPSEVVVREQKTVITTFNTLPDISEPTSSQALIMDQPSHFTPIVAKREPVVFEGRKSRNKSKPLSELAPELLPNRFSTVNRQAQQKEKHEAQMRRKAEVEAKRAEREATRLKKEQERLLNQQRQEQLQKQRQEQMQKQQEQQAENVQPSVEQPSNALNRSARKSLSIKIENLDSESSAGRISSKSVSSPAVFTKRYQAYGTSTSDQDLMENSRFFSRMEHRKFQNPLACGLVPIKSDTSTSDYFYREVLVKKQPEAEIIQADSMEVDEPDDIDILSDETNTLGLAKNLESDDEVLVKNPAFDCVSDIRTHPAFAPLKIEDEENEDALSPIEQITEECNKNEGLMYTHLKTILQSIMNQRLTDLNSLNVVGGCSIFYSQTLRNATRLRDRLCLFTEKRIFGIEDAHAFLLRRLPDEYLASYLNLLRFLKVSGSSLPMHLINQPVDSEIQTVNELIREFVNTKIVDPNLRYKKCVDIAPLPNVSLVLVYPQVSMISQTVVKHAHENMFRNLLPSAVRCVEKVELKFDEDVDPKTLTHMCLALIRERVQELVKRRPDDHVFLAGWGISSLLNMQAIQKVQGVTGVLNFAFPLRSYLGFRGTVDDTICVSYCPSLFVVGDSATNVSVKELQLMREYMICESGLVVVGGADSNLYVSPLTLSVERVSQHCVDRIIFEHVIDFMRMLINEGGMSAKERRQYLKPVKFHNAFDVDLNTLKGRASGFVPKSRQPKENASKRKEKEKNPAVLSSNPTTPMSTEPSTSTLPSPALSGSATFHRQAPPLLSTASSSNLKPAQRMDLYGSSELFDARTSFENALRRRSLHAPVAVCMSEPKNPMAMPITTTAPLIRRESVQQPLPPVQQKPSTPAAPIINEVSMSQETENATASLTSFFANEENENEEDPGF